MMRHPIYLTLGILSAIYLAFANARGWSLIHTVNPFRLFGGGHGSSFSHK